MRLLNNRVLLAGLTAALFAGSLLAQFRSDVRLVVLHASVADKKGKLITDLPKNAFKVYENGQLQDVKQFRREDVPISFGILIDDSGSMRDKRARVEAAALALIKASNPQDEVFIVNYNDEAFLDVPFTNDMSKLQQGLTRIDSRGGTAMRDAINMSIDYVKSDAKKDKKVLLAITDGNDNASTSSLERLVQRARNSGTLVYAIGLLSEEEKREAKKAKRALKEITEATGGLVYYPKEVGDVQQMALQIAQEIRNQYLIAYSPAIQNLDGSYRQIKVTVDAPGKPVVRTRTGYYATPEMQQEAKRSQNHPAKQGISAP